MQAAFDEYREKLEAARKEENEARAAHASKRNVLDGVRSTIGKLNQATSVEEIDELVRILRWCIDLITISHVILLRFLICHLMFKILMILDREETEDYGT